MNSRPQLKKGSSAQNPPDDKHIWHYTLERHLDSILRDRVIKVTDCAVGHHGRAAVWLSSNLDWEEGARQSIVDKKTGIISNLSRDALFMFGFTPARLEIDPNTLVLHSWDQYKRRSGAPKWLIDTMVEIDRGWGADHSEWYISFQPIPLDKCLLSIDVWNGGWWEPSVDHWAMFSEEKLIGGKR